VRRHAIRRRLTLWYAGTLLAVLLGGGLVIERLVDATLEREVAGSLESSTAFINDLFRAEKHDRDVVTTLDHISREVMFPDRVIEFIRPDGRPFVPPTPSTFEHPELKPPLRTTEQPFAEGLAPGWRMRVTLSTACTAQSLEWLHLWFALGIPLAVVAAGVGGWWLTGRTLQPVGVMAAAAERMDATDPSLRLPVADPSDELGRLGVRFNAVLEREENSQQQQRRFLADAAHELRTPLARLRRHLELALHTPVASTGHAGALGLAHQDLTHTTAILDELLQLARADAGERPRELQAGYLDDVIAASFGAWRGAADRRRVALRLERLEEAPARLEPSLVRRLFDILVENAVRYTPTGGSVTVRVFAGDDGGAVLEVEDTGIGIPDAERPQLFERFHRGREARTVAPEGSGLGLAIAQWIVRQHGGSIALLPGTRPGATPGTLARVTLPPIPAPAVHGRFMDAS
jgi:signal transduction histidine kinase